MNTITATYTKNRTDPNLHLATLARFIEATGGRLRITAVYDDDEVEVGIGDLTDAAANAE